MGFHDHFRLSVHAVIVDAAGHVLLLKATYGDQAWGLPGGAIDPGETIHEALDRECTEELGTALYVRYLSGVYSHRSVQSHAFIFRCDLPEDAAIKLSEEHSEYRYFALEGLPPVQHRRVIDCLDYAGDVRSARF